MKSCVFIFLRFIFFFLQPAPVEQHFDLEIQSLFAGHTMRHEIVDGQLWHAMFEVINVVDNFDIGDQHGKEKTSRLLKNVDSKTDLEEYGIYYMKNRYGPATPALNLNGMKALMQYLTSPFAMKFKKHHIHQGTRVDAGDPSLHSVLYANAASSNMYNVMARHQLPHQGASGGASIAAPPEQVLERACLLLLYLR